MTAHARMRLALALGYDPGGNGRHGVAALHLADDGRVSRTEAATADTTQHAIDWLATRLANVPAAHAALGVDTLTTWSDASSGWRPADVWLREKYPKVRNSMIAPNALYGAMVMNGMIAVLRLRERAPDLLVSETHPKVLYYALTRSKYDFENGAAAMTAKLSSWIGVANITAANDHEWDALASAYAVQQGATGAWRDDLHARPAVGGALIHPAGVTQFYWPSDSSSTVPN